MGEVYRADDTKLRHAVALKFLPRRGAVDAATLDRLRAEVRLGRQVSHPNVCRIYDIGESAEGSFIAMEYVDGEDLASLLYRSSTRPMIAWKAPWRIDTTDPPFVQPGMTRIGLDPLGRLISFEAIPSQKEDAGTGATADWNVLFREASLDPSLFHEVRPVWSAPIDVEEKKAWEGTLAEQPDIAPHLEAGRQRGR